MVRRELNHIIYHQPHQLTFSKLQIVSAEEEINEYDDLFEKQKEILEEL